ncbi:Fc.00g094760.m01.CDS01 [Cosmosporella sp. VM-42]
MANFGSDAQVSKSSEIIILVFLSLALYNVIELTFIIWGTFKRHSGLYFWSFLCASWGIPVYCAGFVTKYFAPPALGYLSATLILFGWVAMVTGQSVVLWSRLHLVLRNRFRLKMILWMIIVDGILCHGAVAPVLFGSFSSNPDPWTLPYSIIEKIQVTIFFIQEIVISGIYIVETVKMMKVEMSVGSGKSSRRLMNHLIFVNFLIILLDITILGLEYANQYEIQTSYKAFVYSTKLKLEFTILNRLVEMTTGNKDASSGPRSRTAGTHTRTNIALDTFNDSGNKAPANISYQAYAMGGEEGSSDGRQPAYGRDRGVMMTTEIIVHRENRDDDEIGSIDGKSSADSTIERQKTHDNGALSKSSSEVHLATRGF